jgi:hypothetical protein
MIRGEVNVVWKWVPIRGEPNQSSFLACVTVNGRPLPVEHYEMIPEEPLGGVPLGWINLHNEDCSEKGKHLHLLWTNARGDLRVSTVPAEICRWENLPRLFVGG